MSQPDPIPAAATARRSAREYGSKVWNLPETPEMFHRQAPGFPMRTRCGIEFGREARETSHSLPDYDPCAVCFEGFDV